MNNPTFELIRQQQISSLRINVEQYRHRTTAARHFHLGSDDSNNAFLVAFRTVPEDSTGVAHILEHTSLCGSRKFPVRDPFFMMTRRSLSTFMNAFTASDWTAYPFATQSAKDFDNLLQVYLDATFFPNLNELDFLQEGHRLEFEDADNPDSDLLYKGIVFNEMKGAMSSPVQRIWQDLQSALFPTNTYHYNSGGEPSEITKLTHQQLLDFHARHYHPSNATFFTYGNFPVSRHQERFEELVLDKFEKLDIDLSIPEEQRYTQPLTISTRFAQAETNDDTGKSQVVLAWLLGSVKNLDATMDAQMLASALLDNSASPLRLALETSEWGTAPSELCGFENSMAESVFVCGLEGCKAEDAPQIESMILSVIEKIASEGVPETQLEAILHQIELSQREPGGGHFPYGLQLMVKALSPALHGADPFAVLDIDPVLERLRNKIQDPGYIPALARNLLLENQHRVLMTANPDSTLIEQQTQQEAGFLASVKRSLSDDEAQKIITMTEKLRARQESQDNPELLPSVSIEDAPEDISIPEAESLEINDCKTHFYPAGTNGLVYQQLVIRIPEIEDELIDDLPLFCDCLNEVGIKGHSYLDIQKQQAALTGGLQARLSVRSPIDDLQGINAYLVIAGKALFRNQRAFSELLRDTFSSARFDELERLRELIAQIRAHRESSVTQAGHRLAMQAASSGSSSYAQLVHRWDGLLGTRNIIALDKALEDRTELKKLADRFKRIQAIVIKAPRQFLLVNEQDNLDAVKTSLESVWQESPSPADSLFTVEFNPQTVQQAWTTSTQVNFCAKSYSTVPSGHEDAASLTVLGHFLRNGFLHRSIREQGGAYGGGAGYAADTGSFRFYSYRDPRLAETLLDFDRSVDWLHNHPHEPRQLEEAILGVISDIDRPYSPAGEAIGSWFAQLHGRDPQQRRKFRRQVMAVTLDDLKRVAKIWLNPASANIAVISDKATVEEHNRNFPDLSLTIYPIQP